GPGANLEADHREGGRRKLAAQRRQRFSLSGMAQLEPQSLYAGVVAHDQRVVHVGLYLADARQEYGRCREIKGVLIDHGGTARQMRQDEIERLTRAHGGRTQHQIGEEPVGPHVGTHAGRGGWSPPGKRAVERRGAGGDPTPTVQWATSKG